MGNEIYDRMLSVYDLSDSTKRRNAIFEVNQQPTMKNPMPVENNIERLLIGGGYMIFSWKK